MGETTELLSKRDIGLLHAVAEHRCEILPGWHPVLLVDCRVCDADAARRLIRAGLVVRPGLGTGRWPARLTEAGKAELARSDRAGQPQ